MAEKRVILCDKCIEYYDGADSYKRNIAIYKCFYCKKDLCGNHCHSFSLISYGDKIILGFNNSEHSKDVCRECKENIEKIFESVMNKSLARIQNKIVKELKKRATIEVL